MYTKFYIRFWIPALFFFVSGSVFGQKWNTLFDKADSLFAAGNVQEALVVAKQTLNEAETYFGKNHYNYGQSLSILGNIQISKGDYTDAQLSLEEGRKVYVKLDSIRDLNYTDLLSNLGLLKRIQGHYKQSETIYKEALGIIEQIQGKENADYVGLLGSLGILYTVSQDYTKAETLLLNVLAMKAKLSGKQNSDYASTLSSLGTLYSERENYSGAEPYLLEALRIREKILGADHLTVGFTLNNLGYLYMKQGDYQTAIRLFDRVISLCDKKTPGSQMHIAALNNVGQCYISTNQYTKANFFLQKALVVTSEKLGADHPNYAVALNNLADSEEKQGHYQTVEKLHQEALRIYTAKMGAENIGTAEMLANIAKARVSLNRTNGVDSLYKAAFLITEKTLGKSSLAYAGILNQFAHFLSSQQKTDSSLAATAAVQAIINQNLAKIFLYQTARQKQSLLDKWIPIAQSAFDIAWEHPQRADAAGLAYSGNLFLKNLLLSQHISLFADTSQTANGSLRLLTDTLRLVSNQIATQYTLPIAQRKILDSLETRAETLEKELARQSAPFRQAQKDLQVRWEDIRNALKPHEAAIEFVSFPYHNGRQQTDTIRYMALVLRPGDTSPQIVPLLTDEAPLRQLLAHRKGATLYATRGSEIDSDQLAQGDSLYRLIWQSIDRLLTNTKTVYVSPSGLLHQVAFAALPYHTTAGKASQYLVDHYQIKQVSSTRQVASQATDVSYQDIHSAQLYGGIQYDSTSSMSGTWSFLPGTKREVEQIGQFIGTKALIIAGDKATETSLKDVSGQSPAVLHVATHGFSFPDPAVSANDTSAGGATFRRIANPLFRTGLLMADANRVWQGGQSPLGKDDGILTAYEVSNLNLSSTKLVVLSACETALGDIRGSEGVFGLQRAFKMAGVQYLLMSLWPVSDQVTSSLMTQFYRNWKKYKTVRQAFQQTQVQLKKQYPPAVWASFVLVE